MNRRRVALVAVAVVTAAGAVAYGAQRWASARDERIAMAMTGGDPARAPALMRRYGCVGCHTIPGIDGADGRTGPRLVAMRERVYVGSVPNTADNLVRWIVSAREATPHAAMPVTGITASDAKDIAAWLYAH